VTTASIVSLTRRQTRDASETLARAFDDSPIFRHLVPGDRARGSILRSFFTAAIRDALPFGDVYAAVDGARVLGASVWLEPGRYPPSGWRQLRQLTGTFKLGPLAPRSIAPSLRYLRVGEQVHPKEPHWYLAILGVEPGEQGRGLGGALLRGVLERADRDGVPAYLETDKERNLAYYSRFRFTLRDTLHPDGPDAPPEWTMWRDPA
jgi:GNAT superfamily N-acetyltransferase